MAISGLLRRFGFVKLDDFGLILTPEGRILSARSVVLDDGLGGKVVGWQEGDLAAMELERWEPALPATRKAGKKVVPPLPPAARIIAPVAAPVAAAPAIAAPVAAVPVAAVPVAAAPAPRPLPGVRPVVAAPAPARMPKRAPSVDGAPGEEEDEWEWEIAVARARAAAEWAEEAADTVTAAPARKDPMSTDNWPKTEPLLDAWEATGTTDRPVRVLPRSPSLTPPKPIVIAAPAPQAARPLAPRSEPSVIVAAQPAPRAKAPTSPITPQATQPGVGEHTSPTIQTSAVRPVAAPASAIAPPVLEQTSPSITAIGDQTSPSLAAAPRPARATVIPVPALSLADPRSITPRPRPNTGAVPVRPPSAVMAPPRRYPRSTPNTATTTALGTTSEDTLVNHAAAPANDDLTSPGLLAPSPASSSKRVAAKQR